jgi:hypothetical protein
VKIKGQEAAASTEEAAVSTEEAAKSVSLRCVVRAGAGCGLIFESNQRR